MNYPHKSAVLRLKVGRKCVGTWALIACGILGGVLSRAAPAEVDRAVRFERSETWAPHSSAAPETSKDEKGQLVIRANGTRTCCGGWQLHYSGIRGGQAYRFRARIRHEGLRSPRDVLVAMVLWDEWENDRRDMRNRPWNYLLPVRISGDVMELDGIARAPAGATRLTVRYTFRWSTRGSSSWETPRIEPATLPERKPVKVCVVGATKQARDRIRILPLSKDLGLPADVSESVDLWGSLVLAACERKPGLIVTPEIVIGGKHFLEGAIEVPGPATRPFQKIARDYGTHIVLGVKERDGDAVRNSAVLVSPRGKVAGVYRKVHLAVSESISGVLPGDSFPVFDTGIGKVGCLICMDTTVSESARMLALNGADFICFPIMGDLRASRWSPGSPIFNEDRWRAIMRTRAIDNQVCMVVARNNVTGSCIIDRKGDILAWNEGDQEVIEATVPLEDGYRTWDGGDFREVTFLLRRPELYELYTDPECLGPVRGLEMSGEGDTSR